jgi:hypothetical protein
MLVAIVMALPGCSLLLRNTDIGTSEISYIGGELVTTEDYALADLHAACGAALETLGYETGQQTLDEEKRRGRLRARTARGEQVEIGLIARGSGRTELHIRVGVAGDEVRSRLVLEQIHRSL